MLTDKLDTIPQIPQDWANHIIYGSLGAMLIAAWAGWTWALVIVLSISAGKKIYDYFVEHETLQICIQKTFVTAAEPLLVCFHMFPPVA